MSYIKIQIIRAEGENWDNSSLGCYVSVDSELLDVVTPLNSQHESNIIKVPAKGYLKLYVKTMGDSSKFLGNVTVPVELLPSKGYVWLPLFNSVSDSLVNRITDSVSNPKVLLGISTEQGEIPAEPDEVLRDRLLNSELKLIVKELQKQLTEECSSRNMIHQAYLALISTNSKQITSAEAREASLIHLLEQKDVEIQRLRALYEKSEQASRCASEEKLQLLQKIENLKAEDYVAVIQRLSSELDEIKKLFTASVKQRSFLCGQLKLSDFQETQFNLNERNLLELKAEVIQYDEELKTLRLKLNQSEHTRETLCAQIFELQQLVDMENVENLIGECSAIKPAVIDGMLAQLGLVGSFKRVNHCYFINDRLAQIVLEDEKLYAQTDHECAPIEEFLQQSFATGDRSDFGSTRSFNNTLRSNSSKKSLPSKYGENQFHDKSSKKLYSSIRDFKAVKKVPERLLREKNFRESSIDRKSVSNLMQ